MPTGLLKFPCLFGSMCQLSDSITNNKSVKYSKRKENKDQTVLWFGDWIATSTCVPPFVTKIIYVIFFFFFSDVYEVGVHIADVSYFMKPDTALDRVASKRATTTYLVHKVCGCSINFVRTCVLKAQLHVDTL